MKKIGIVAKPNSENAKEIVSGLYQWLKKKNVEIFLEKDTALLIGNMKHYPKGKLSLKVDCIIVLGGDGTLLSVVRRLKVRNVPILGINMGFLGFLTALTLEEMYPALEKLLDGKFSIETRSMLSVRVKRGRNVLFKNCVLNDAVITKGKIARVINLEIRINKQYVTKYRSDGLIVATPTGSTGYSLAAGGPILYPAMEGIVLSPICPHTLTNRPLVVPANVEIETTLTSETRNVVLTLDGQEACEIEYKDKICVKTAKRTVSLIQFEGKNHYEVLNRKFHWGK